MFDPYAKWLGIIDCVGRPTYFQLLGLTADVDDPDVIANAADMRMAHVRSLEIGEYAGESQRLLNELAQARVCLLDPQRRAAYRASLAAGQEAPLQGPATSQPQSAPAGQAESADSSEERPLKSPPQPAAREESRWSDARQPARRPGPPPSSQPVITAPASTRPAGMPTVPPPRQLVVQPPRLDPVSGGNKAIVAVLAAILGVGAAIGLWLAIASRGKDPALQTQVGVHPSGMAPSPVESTKRQPRGVIQQAATASSPSTESATATADQITPAEANAKRNGSGSGGTNVRRAPTLTDVPAEVRYQRGESVDLLAYVAQTGDAIKVAGPPPSEFQMTATGLRKLPAPADLQASLVPLPLGFHFDKANWKREDYRLSARLTTKESGAIFVSFPVSDRQFVAFIGGAGKSVGFAVTPAATGDAVRKDVGPLLAGHDHQLEITVHTFRKHQAKIVVRLNDSEVIDWYGKFDKVGPDGAVTPLRDQDKYVVFGFGAQQDLAVELTEFRVKSLRHEASK